jgi:hypothetical protein
MASEDLATAYGHAGRLRAHEVEYQLDLWLGKWIGPGGKLVSQAAIERAIQPAKPVRAIAAG